MHPPIASQRNIVIVGGGFAGTTLARELEPRLPPDCRLLLISEESYTTFNPMLAEVVGAAIFPEQVIAPIRQMLRSARFVMGRVKSVDCNARQLQCETLGGPLQIGYDHLVLAFGQRASLHLIPGLAEFALPLKLVGDAMHIRNRVLQRLARMELCADPRERSSLGHFVVIGGGFSGVEVAGALADFLCSARRYYPRLATADLQVTLLHDMDRLLPELPARLGHSAARSLSRRGVKVRLMTRAARVDERSVLLADGTALDCDTVVCTIGTRPNSLVESLGLATARGRIKVEPDGRVLGHPSLWAAGDCAAWPNAATGDTCPPTAQSAVAQAGRLAANLAAHLAEQPTKPLRHVSKGMMATTGHHRGVALAFGVPLTGLPAWLMWRAYYLARMPTLGRKLRIWVEWTWSLFFPADITHLRFTRTAEVEAVMQPAQPAPVLPPQL